MESPSKKCSKCHEEKPLALFHAGDCRGGKQSWCKACHVVIMRAWREANRERANELARRSAAKHRVRRNAYRKKYYEANKAEQLRQRRNLFLQLKEAAYVAYGGHRCVCCGETERAFLSIDHVENDGAAHRKVIGRGNWIYRWLKDNNYPAGFQVLCMNCNFGKRINKGICPHVEAQYGIQIREV